MASVESVPAYMLPGVPVVQPSHLEGDPSLATEILPGPPSLLSIQQAGLPRRDHRKTVSIFSYLPTSDPGTTYTGHMETGKIGQRVSLIIDPYNWPRADEVSSPANPTSRAQRASARNLNVSTSVVDSSAILEAMASSSNLIPDSDPIAIDTDEPVLSRSNSLPNVEEVVSINGNSRRGTTRRDKGKGRDKDAGVRVKEEPSVVTLPPGDPAPLKPPARPPASLKFLIPLIEHLQTTLPIEFQLPQDIRSHFKDVATGPKGTYVDSSELKPPRLNRHGQLEERDPYRLKDRNGEPVLCFQCGTSALPPGVAASAHAAKRARRESSQVHYSESGRSIISCDYCHLHWHLDCVDPPLSVMPSWNKKWMCPNHADRVLQPKRRIPKNSSVPLEITQPHQPNNGNVEVIQPQTAVATPSKVVVDEVLINGRRYRIPERIITLDFWDKVGKNRHITDTSSDQSVLSSPLTSLSSLAGDADTPVLNRSIPLFSLEDIEMAQLLARLQMLQKPSMVLQDPAGLSHDLNSGDKRVVGRVTDQQSNANVPAFTSELKAPVHLNGTAKSATKLASHPAALNGKPTSSAPKAESSRIRRTTTQRQRNGARSSRKQTSADDTDYVPITVDMAHTSSTRGRRTDQHKSNLGKGTLVEQSVIETSSQTNGSSEAVALDQLQRPQISDKGQPEQLQSTSIVPTRPKRQRQPARKRLSPIPLSFGATNVLRNSDATADDRLDGSEEPETPLSALRPKISTMSRVRKKPVGSSASQVKRRSPSPPPAGSRALATTGNATPGPSGTKATESTPTLKIRLPRLGSINLPSMSAPPVTPSPATQTKVLSARGSRRSNRANSRRSSRRQPSMSTSLNETSVSSEAV
ncbi:uncharacterized protein FIBRA_05028 [Fibroporia radiculosa]|uniref:Zinc finger PHD-type domain-containing protein n=1 Tax=Fibroporia radiculosa TaxID=599839 RepID=J4H3A1_9APHY|nr:uncharacterized protein FIBRA_05028 [Fibroporia radiculosa]CCM02914.1 predicted protein [Fibroporia radiculosa]